MNSGSVFKILDSKVGIMLRINKCRNFFFQNWQIVQLSIIRFLLVKLSLFQAVLSNFLKFVLISCKKVPNKGGPPLINFWKNVQYINSLNRKIEISIHMDIIKTIKTFNSDNLIRFVSSYRRLLEKSKQMRKKKSEIIDNSKHIV